MIYRFGECEVDTKLLELRRDGEVRQMDPLGFDLLVYLIENRDRVVTRDELLDALWPGKVVTDSALSSRLKSVRSAVGDTGSSQRIIKTVHGRGYRFVADMADQPDAPAPTELPVEAFSGKTAAVGRDAELGKLMRWQQRANDGHPQVVLISGDAGVGKTTLARAFLETAERNSDALVLSGQCVNQRGASEAYLPLLEALGRSGQDHTEVKELLRQHAPAWLAQLPSLLHDAASIPDQLTVGVTPGRMLRELSDFLDHLAAQRNVILILEDLHWSDPSTVEWLDYYARRSGQARLMLVATCRPAGPHEDVCRELSTRGHAHDLRLDAIDEAYVSDYLNQRLDHPPAPALAAVTFRRTGGFPLFIDTLVDHWLENGLVQRKNGTWSATANEEELLAGVPENLSQLIDQQLASLNEDERLLLETAALAGSPFTSAAVAYALEEEEEKIEAQYGRMARQGRIVRNVGEAHWPDGTVTATFEFRHELYREALYQCVAASRRSRLHAALGERLEKAYGDEPGPLAGEIADHFARAHDVGRALKYFYPAALLSFNRSANREALAIANRALDLIGEIPETADSQQIERDLQLLKASALISQEGWASDGVETAYTRARELALKLGLEDYSPEMFGIAAMHELRGRYAESQEVLESLLAGSTSLGLEAHELLACSLFHQGKFEQSIQNADQAIEQYNETEISAILARYGENPGVSCHGWAALDLWFMGYPDSAIQRSDSALAIAQGHFYSYATALTHRTFLHQFRNELEETISWADKTHEVAEKQGFDFRIAQTMILKAWAEGLLARQKTEQQAALQQIDDALERHKSMGAEMDAPYYVTLKSDLLAHMGKIDEALDVQEQALDMYGDDRDFFYEAEMRRLYALLMLRKDKSKKNRAVELLDQSLDVARRQGARLLELKTCISRCELANGAKSPYVDDLKQVVSALPEGRDTADWQAASAFI
jgi:DNA-binding winged helix-turn-helix (wHTH) protein/tetratricopeptide (TPR) repeat protein